MVSLFLMPPSAASMIESAAKAGGTKMIETSAPVFSTASLTVLKTACPSVLARLYRE